MCERFIIPGADMELVMSRKEVLTASSIDALKNGVIHDPQTPELSIVVTELGKNSGDSVVTSLAAKQ